MGRREARKLQEGVETGKVTRAAAVADLIASDPRETIVTAAQSLDRAAAAQQPTQGPPSTIGKPDPRASRTTRNPPSPSR